MKKRIISTVLALIICLSLTTCALAVADTNFVVDEIGYLSENEVEDLNNLAAELYDAYNYLCFYLSVRIISIMLYKFDSLRKT